jgi:hypothetical protein
VCLDCGCHIFDDDHGDDRHLTVDDLSAAADASGIGLLQAAANIVATVQDCNLDAGTTGDDADGDLIKATEQRYLLAVAYQADRDPRIQKGADGGRDFFSPEELEKAAWSFLPGGAKVGLFHGPDDTIGHFTVTESYIYRGPNWDFGDGVVVKSGDWLIGGICDEVAWDLYKRGLITGMSPQGVARRRAA